MRLEKFVVLTGIDGSGKTRHARRLLFECASSGRKCKYVWMRSAYFLSLPFMVICRVLGFTAIHKLPDGRKITEHVYNKKPVSLIWPWIQLADLILFVSVKNFDSLIRRDLSVVDRFIYDIIVDLMVDVNDPNLHKSLVGQLMFRLIPSGSISFLFDVDERTAMMRKVDVPNYRYLKVRRAYYLEIARSLKIVSIDSSPPFNTVHEHLRAKLQEQKKTLALNYIEKQLRKRLQARARWKKWKKGPVAFFKNLLNERLAQLVGKARITKAKSRENIDNAGFVQDMRQCFSSYVDLLRTRGLEVHTVILVGSRAKNRWNPKSDIDTIVVASRLPKYIIKYMSRFVRAQLLSDIPLFCGIEPYGCTEEEFLEKLENLDLMSLDAICCGRIVFDDGFWRKARSRFREVEEEYGLQEEQLGERLSVI